MDISARAFSLADRPRLDHLGHQCLHAPGRPNLHLVSSSRRPRLETANKPGGNVTGSTFQSEVIVEKELQLLQETVIKLSLVGLFINPTNPVYRTFLVAGETAAKSLNLRIKSLGAEKAADIDTAFESARQDGVGALLVLRDPVFVLNASRFVTLAEKYRLPTLYGLREFVVAGGLMSTRAKPPRFVSAGRLHH
jgi:ABC-type uncharacterized transport system substrate-binding protein